MCPRLPRTACLLRLIALCILLSQTSAYFGLTGREPLVFLPAPLSNESPSGKAHLKQCEQLTLTRRQKRLCRREPGLAETLRESVRLSLLECRYQFRNERWNCSLDGRGSLLKRGFKETAFLLAVSSAALTHALAKACSSGRMERCTCDDSPDLEHREAWQWGICGDNLKYSTKFLKNFLGQKRVSKDLRAQIDSHNINVGVRAVKSGLKTTCKCHGVSGSCAVRTCWKQLSPFHDTGRLLKFRYDSAVRVLSVTNAATGGGAGGAPAPRPQPPLHGPGLPGGLAQLLPALPLLPGHGRAALRQGRQLPEPVLRARLQHRPAPHHPLLPLPGALVLPCGVPDLPERGGSVHM
ncbi:hypothetical protein ANANG_G00043610 [Anguilla anguilla]|uniref:Protein Wnt n=1 Tax=Anguilla anguilla TaxID=7936 RepID=A0A9D3MUH0_ANGAN|nr:hypothetical protein ANANG_G00043610 [Anguilla anguilla]